MKELDFFRRQFILTKHDNLNLPWKKEVISDYNLFYHPDLEFEHVRNNGTELFLLGFLFDYSVPGNSNKDILENLSKTDTFEKFIESLAEYSGHFVIIYKSTDRFVALNDAGAQKEVYYDDSFTTFASQPKLIERVLPVKAHTSAEAKAFYSSAVFNKRKLYIGTTTHAENIYHLTPNHLINIEKKQVLRYYPDRRLSRITLEEASEKIRKMLKGYIEAASIRHKLAMGVTAGYDSRVLFLSSLDFDCSYYVTQLDHMTKEHSDIKIPLKLTGIFEKPFHIIVESNEPDDEQMQKSSVNFPRYPKRPGKDFENHMIVNGNLSEIARHRFSSTNAINISADELTYLYGYSKDAFVNNENKKWLKNSSSIFSDFGYNIFDMYYWEEKMGVWAAKAKTEMDVLGVMVYSPFCSHKLITTLLSVPKKYRDNTNTKLYNHIIKELSPECSKIPVNPSLKRTLKRNLLKFHILNPYRRISLKLRFMKPYYGSKSLWQERISHLKKTLYK